MTKNITICTSFHRLTYHSLLELLASHALQQIVEAARSSCHDASVCILFDRKHLGVKLVAVKGFAEVPELELLAFLGAILSTKQNKKCVLNKKRKGKKKVNRTIKENEEYVYEKQERRFGGNGGNI